MPNCYSRVNTTEVFTVSGQQKCGSSVNGVSYWCNDDDTCRDDAICFSTVAGPGKSGFYVAGCTDPDLPEPCSRSCSESWIGRRARRAPRDADPSAHSRSEVAGYCVQGDFVGLLLSRVGLHSELLRYVFQKPVNTSESHPQMGSRDESPNKIPPFS